MTSDSAPIRRAYELWSARAWEEYAQLLHPDVVFEPDPSWPEPDPCVGRDAVVAWHRDASEGWEGLEVEIEQITEGENGHLVVGRLRGRAQGSGIEGAVPFAQVFSLEDGKITRLTSYLDPDQARRAAGLMTND